MKERISFSNFVLDFDSLTQDVSVRRKTQNTLKENYVYRFILKNRTLANM